MFSKEQSFNSKLVRMFAVFCLFVISLIAANHYIPWVHFGSVLLSLAVAITMTVSVVACLHSSEKDEEMDRKARELSEKLKPKCGGSANTCH